MRASGLGRQVRLASVSSVSYSSSLHTQSVSVFDPLTPAMAQQNAHCIANHRCVLLLVRARAVIGHLLSGGLATTRLEPPLEPLEPPLEPSMGLDMSATMRRYRNSA